MISGIFSNKLIIDDRQPILTLTLYGHEYGLFPPHMMFWVQLLVAVIPCATFSILMATITYTQIIPRRGTFVSSLVGFGVVIPLCIFYFPFWILSTLDIRNKLLRFCISAIYPVLTIFKTSEAVFGFSPHSVESSYKNYILYYATGVEIEYDKRKLRPVAATFDEKVTSLQNFLMCLVVLGLYKSIFGPYNYEPFQTTANGNEPGYDWKDIFDLNLLCNNFVSTMLLQLYLTTFIAALSVMVKIIFRVKVQEGVMKNPLMKASSPSDFWGGRWNLLVHGVLKRGVFKPVYSVSSKLIAVLATFLASGLFHEYILIAVNPENLGFRPELGKNTAFMMWNAGIIIVEALIGNAKIFALMKNSIPSLFVTILVLCTAMPVAHWFLHPYIKSEMYVHGEVAMPMIKVIR